MAANVSDRVLDNGLTVLDTEATHIYITSAEASSYANVAAVALGNKNFGAGGCFGAPAAGSPNGRKVTSTGITDGAVTATGTATHWAVTDNANSRLLAVGSLASPQVVTNGNTYTLGSFDIRLPSQ